MNISEVAIKRPVFTVMMTVALLVLGWVGFSSLGTDLFPDVSFPVVAITVPYPGASPNEVETLVTKPVEDSVVGLNQIDRVRSFSREGVSQTLVMFKLGKDISDGATEVREKVAGIRWKLPQEVKEPTINRWDVSATPILIYTLSSTKSLSAARKYAEDVIKPVLEQVEGVAVVEVKGGATREIRVELERSKIDALKLDPAGLVMRLRAANLNVPAGHYDEGTKEVSVRTLGDFTNVEAIRDTIVATAADGSAVKLRDVARVDDAFADRTELIRSNGNETVSFSILKQSGKNTIEVADQVKAKLATLQKKLPGDMQSAEIFDQSRFIKENVHEVETAIVFGGAMAILIILIFMLDLRSTMISAVALPTSVIGTFFVMYLLGYTLNMMTLLGLSLAIGLLIDDAVVVRENIFKHLEMGKTPTRAALEGTKEIALSVFATTLTIVAVFLPVAFVKGMVGQFFRQFGITISVAVMISLVVAFTLDPMLSSKFSKTIHRHADGSAAAGHDPTKESFYWLKRPFLWFFEGMDNVYRGMLGWAVSHKLVVGVLAIGSLFFMGFIAKLTGSEFVNAEDRGQFITELELPAGTSLDETARLSARGEELLRKSKHVITVFSTVEGNKAKWRVITTTKDKRLDTPINVIKEDARKAAATIENAAITLGDPAFVEGAATEAPIMLDVRGSSYDDVLPAANQLAKILEKTPGVVDVKVKFSPGRPELQVEIDRQKAADLGVGVAQIALALRTAMEGEEAGKLRIAATSTTKSEEVPIVVRLSKGDRDTEAALAKITIATSKGPVKLTDVAKFSRGEGPQVIEREDRSRQIQVWASPKGRALGDIVAEIKPQIAAMKLPAGVSIAYDGQIRMMEETNGNMGTALLLGVIFIYIVLASQFESFIHPLTIMLTLPLAFVGAFLGLFMAGTTLAMGAMIGIILLMGLVTKNAILLIDRAIVRVREHNETPLQAILEAGPERLRPILMTSAAMVLGMLPTALGKGEGSEFRSPMAIAVIGGVISSTLLSLLVVPAFYVAIESLKGWIRKLRGVAPVSRRPEALGTPAE